MRSELKLTDGQPLWERSEEGLRNTLCSILSGAVEEGYLTNNPAWRVYKPKGMRKERPVTEKENGLPQNVSVHSLRHTNASLLIAQGVDVRTVAGLLGHSQPSTTLDIYAHAFEKTKREAQEKLAKVMGL